MRKGGEKFYFDLILGKLVVKHEIKFTPSWVGTFSLCTIFVLNSRNCKITIVRRVSSTIFSNQIIINDKINFLARTGLEPTPITLVLSQK